MHYRSIRTCAAQHEFVASVQAFLASAEPRTEDRATTALQLFHTLMMNWSEFYVDGYRAAAAGLVQYLELASAYDRLPSQGLHPLATCFERFQKQIGLPPNGLLRLRDIVAAAVHATMLRAESVFAYSVPHDEFVGRSQHHSTATSIMTVDEIIAADTNELPVCTDSFGYVYERGDPTREEQAAMVLFDVPLILPGPGPGPKSMSCTLTTTATGTGTAAGTATGTAAAAAAASIVSKEAKVDVRQSSEPTEEEEELAARRRPLPLPGIASGEAYSNSRLWIPSSTSGTADPARNNNRYVPPLRWLPWYPRQMPGVCWYYMSWPPPLPPSVLALAPESAAGPARLPTTTPSPSPSPSPSEQAQMRSRGWARRHHRPRMPPRAYASTKVSAREDTQSTTPHAARK